MFYNVFLRLCADKKVSPSRAAEEIGLNRAAVAKWKKGSRPSAVTALKLSAYFGVTMEELLGENPQEQAAQKAPALEPDKRHVEDILADARRQLEQDGLMFNGAPAAPEAVESILAAMEVGIQLARQRSPESKRRTAAAKRKLLDESKD